MDGVANLLAGSTQPVAQLVSAYTLELGGTPVSSVIGHGFKTNPLNAAFANGVSGHCLDFELQGQPSSHGTSSILPGPLALAEAQGGASGNPGADCGLCPGLGRPAAHRRGQPPRRRQPRGFHPPGVYGPLGGTASAAKMLKLTQEQVQMALGIAASRTGGLFANNGTMVKSTHPGNAARMSTEAALLARRGFLSHDAIFEAPGLCLGAVRRPLRLGRLPGRRRYGLPLSRSRLQHQALSVQIGMQPVINVMSDLRDTYHLTQDEVATVEIELSRAPGHESRPHPTSGLDGKFSFEYCAIIPLVNNPVGIDSFSDATRFTPAVDG